MENNLLRENARYTYTFNCVKCGEESLSHYAFQKYCEKHSSNSVGKTGNKRLRFKILERDGFKCNYCGRNPREHDTVLHVDHIIPLAKGGSSEESNLVTACIDCNQGKANLKYQIQLI